MHSIEHSNIFKNFKPFWLCKSIGLHSLIRIFLKSCYFYSSEKVSNSIYSEQRAQNQAKKRKLFLRFTNRPICIQIYIFHQLNVFILSFILDSSLFYSFVGESGTLKSSEMTHLFSS